MVDGAAYLVRNGATTCFWLDTWIGMEPLITKATANVPDSDQQLKVNQYWQNNSWAWDKIINILPQEVIFLLSSMFIDTNSTVQDEVYWKYTSNGMFTTNSAYLHSLQENNQPDNQIWLKIWHLNAIPKHKSLIWLMYHD